MLIMRNFYNNFLSHLISNILISFDLIFYESPLNLAIKMNNNEIIKNLLENQSINVNIKNYKNVIKKKSENDENLEEKNEITALEIAIDNSNIDAVKYLLENKDIDINAKSIYFKEEDISRKYEDEKTALHSAVEKENLDIIQLLLKHKSINIEEKNKKDEMPIELTNNENIKKMLLA